VNLPDDMHVELPDDVAAEVWRRQSAIDESKVEFLAAVQRACVGYTSHAGRLVDDVAHRARVYLACRMMHERYIEEAYAIYATPSRLVIEGGEKR